MIALMTLVKNRVQIIFEIYILKFDFQDLIMTCLSQNKIYEEAYLNSCENRRGVLDLVYESRASKPSHTSFVLCFSQDRVEREEVKSIGFGDQDLYL